MIRWPPDLKNEACLEAYKYFDKNIRLLPKNSKGKFDELSDGYVDNDVDAFRHAYVSGRFTHVYGATVADIFGRMNEIISFSPSTGGGQPATNMDLWNNAVGRKYGKKTLKRETLLKAIHKSLKAGEMIIDLKDSRKYKGEITYNIQGNKSVIVLKQNKTGRNEKYYDLATNRAMTRSQFVTAIRKGEYPGYRIANYYGLSTPVSKKDNLLITNLG